MDVAEKTEKGESESINELSDKFNELLDVTYIISSEWRLEYMMINNIASGFG